MKIIEGIMVFVFFASLSGMGFIYYLGLSKVLNNQNFERKKVERVGVILEYTAIVSGICLLII